MPSAPLARVAASGIAVLALASGFVAASLLPGSAPPAAAAGLTPYDGCAPLLRHYRAELRREATPWGVGEHPFHAVADGGPAMPGGAPALRTTAEQDSARAVGPGGTGTNVQEAGVDEPDTAKIADGMLATFSGGTLRLLRAGGRPELLSATKVSEGEGWGELLLAGDRLLVLVPGWRDRARPAGAEPGRGGPGTSDSLVVPTRPGVGTTTVVLYDVSDPRRPRRLEDYTIDGQYVSARLAAGRVRLVTMSRPVLPGVQPQPPHGPAEERRALAENRRVAGRAGVTDLVPAAIRRDGSGRVVERGPALGCTDVRRAAQPRGAATLVVTTLVPQRGLEPAHTTGVTTDGDLVYASADRLYVATSRWGTAAPAGRVGPTGTPAAPSRRADEVTTEIHAFATGDRDRTDYVGSGSVPGYVIGRWALSFHEGHLRVATTRQPPWDGAAAAPARLPDTSSSVAVLAEGDGRLVEVGRVDGLGPGERIYAVRYLGDLATVVTFRQTDPLYVLDLADPAEPRVLGELKIPGFSTYLHPVGGDRLLGVGHDADAQGRVTGTQLSLFDLSDRAAPRQLSRLPLGDGHSAALHESRAFGYDPARGLALLPFSSWSGEPTGTHAALGVTVTPDGRLVETGRLRLGGTFPAERVLHDGTHVYAVGPGGIVAGDAATFERTGTVEFPAPTKR